MDVGIKLGDGLLQFGRVKIPTQRCVQPFQIGHESRFIDFSPILHLSQHRPSRIRKPAFVICFYVFKFRDGECGNIVRFDVMRVTEQHEIGEGASLLVAHRRIEPFAA